MTQQYGEYDEYGDWTEFDDPQQSQQSSKSGSGLRAQLEEVLAQNKTLIETLNQERTQRATENLRGRLASRNLDPGIVSLVPQNLSVDEQNKWLDTNAHLFAKTVSDAKGAEAQTGSTPSEEQVVLPEGVDAMQAQQEEALTAQLTPSEIAAMQKMAQQGGTGEAPPGSQDPMTRLQQFDTSKHGNVNDEDEFWRFVNSQK